MDEDETLPEWACPRCWGYGTVGNGGEGGVFLDWMCPDCNGTGAKPGTTPPWEAEP